LPAAAVAVDNDAACDIPSCRSRQSLPRVEDSVISVMVFQFQLQLWFFQLQLQLLFFSFYFYFS